jgi:hypothetical protein
MRLRALGLAAGMAGLVVCAATTGAAASATSAMTPTETPHWHVIKAVNTGATGEFSAVVATGSTTGWAFDGVGASKGPAAWQWKGATWTRVTFPGKPDEEVTAAAAVSPSDVWALDTSIFQTGSRVVHWNGHKWSALKSFSGGISGASVLSDKNIWLFGYPSSPGIPALGVWHYNGKTWAHVSKALQGGSALAGNSAWAYNGTSVDHWNGTKWVAASVKNLLPAALKTHLNDPTVTGILALSATNVYAIGNGNLQDEGGPTVVLHYNGHKWSKVASGQFGLGAGQQLSADGSGGLWLPMPGVDGQQSFLVHYAAGKLAKANLPIAADSVSINSVARIPGTKDQLAGGLRHKVNDPGVNVVAVVLEYS